MFLGSTESDKDKPMLLRVVEAIVAGPTDIRMVADECARQVRETSPELMGEDHRVRVADTIIARYARTCGRVGSVTALSSALASALPGQTRAPIEKGMYLHASSPRVPRLLSSRSHRSGRKAAGSVHHSRLCASA